MVSYAAIRCASALDANGRARMALEGPWYAIMMYWFPLRAFGVNLPVSSVNKWLDGITVMSSMSVGSAGATSMAGRGGGDRVFVDCMC